MSIYYLNLANENENPIIFLLTFYMYFVRSTELWLESMQNNSNQIVSTKFRPTNTQNSGTN